MSWWYDLTVPELYASYSIQTTRGCPRTCAYCTLPVIYGSVYRHKSVEQIVRETRAITTCFIHKEHSLKLLQTIAKENITGVRRPTGEVSKSTYSSARYRFCGLPLQKSDKNRAKAISPSPNVTVSACFRCWRGYHQAQYIRLSPGTHRRSHMPG